MTILVTSGAGYLGVPLVTALLEQKYEVRILDTLPYGAEPLRPLLASPTGVVRS